MLLNQNRHINTTPPTPASLDFSALLSAGITQCQALGSSYWTDYNEHDPGVTTLEQLCYALTDLAYRASFSMADLLAEHPGSLQPGMTSLYTGDRALSSAPLTQDDFRKVLLSVAYTQQLTNFKNAWLEPVSTQGLDGSGLYTLLIEAYDVSSNAQDLEQKCADTFTRHRNLCEELVSTQVLGICGIKVEASIELEAGVPAENALADILYAIQHMLVPFVRIDSVAQQLAGGVSPDQVFCGPLLTCGYIADDQLAPRRKHVSSSDVSAAIVGVAGVLSASGLKIGSSNEWAGDEGVIIEDNQVPRLEPSIFSDQSVWEGLKLTRSGQTLPVDTVLVNSLLQQKLGQLHSPASADAQLEEDYSKLPAGRNRDVPRYVSIQNHFPQVYGIGKGGPEQGQPQDYNEVLAQTARKAKVRQLRAYLLHFEQMLADCGAQLSNAGRLLSLDPSLKQSYFWQNLLDLPEGPPDMVELLRAPSTGAGPAPAGGDRYAVQVEMPDGLGLRSREFGDAASAAAGADDILLQGSDGAAYELRTLSSEQKLWLIKDGSGAALAFGKRLYASAEDAEKDKPAMIGHLRLLAGDSAARSRDLRVECHGSRSARLVDDHGTVLLSADGLTAAEQAAWTSRLLRDGCNGANYRSQQQPDGRWRVVLAPQGVTLAEGAQRYASEEDAAHAIAAMVGLVQNLCCNHDAQGQHIVLKPQPSPSPDPQRGVQAYKRGMEHLVAAQDPWRLRRMRFLDHLLARFNETFEDGALRQADPRSGIDPDAFEQNLIDCKLQFLRHFVECYPALEAGAEPLAYGLGGGRMRGMDHGTRNGDGEAVHSSLASRLRLLLAMPSRRKEKSAEEAGGGTPPAQQEELHVIENVLLKEIGAPAESADTALPDSFYFNRATVVLPSSPQRFQSPAFRALAEQMVMENCPAHLEANTLWLDDSRMSQFDALYANWKKLRGKEGGWQAAYALARFLYDSQQMETAS